MNPDVAKLEAIVDNGGPSHRLEDMRFELTREALLTAPPKRLFLLSTSSGDGVVPKGCVVVFAGVGGAGKTQVAVQAGTSIAIGSMLFGIGGWQSEQGRVVEIPGEEDGPELLRRHHRDVRDLTHEQIDAVVANVVLFPGMGHSIQLIDHDGRGGFIETAFAAELRDFLQRENEAGRPISCVVLDPYNRLTCDENDNVAARLVIQTCETFTSPACGSPTVIVVAHLRKAGIDDDPDSVDTIRGGKALTDNSRCVLALQPFKRVDNAPDLLKLANPKNNYAPRAETLTLCRPTGGGSLRLATDAEINTYGTMKAGKGSATVAENVERVVEVLASVVEANAASPHGLTKEEIRERLGVGARAANAAIEAAEGRGLIHKLGPKRGFAISKAGQQ